MADSEKLGELLVEIGIEATGFQAQMGEISRRMGMAKAEFMAAGGSVKEFQSTTEGAATKAKMLTEQVKLQQSRVQLLEKEYNVMAHGMGENSTGAIQLKTELGTLNSELAKATQEFGADSKEVQTLKTQISALENEFQTTAHGFGENSKQAQELKAKLDGARGELVKIETELQKSNSSLAQFGARMIESGKSTKELGKNVSEIGETLTMGLTVPVMGAVAALGELVVKSSDAGKEITKTADMTGLSTERVQELQYVAGQLDVSLDTLTGSQARLVKAMEAASKGSGQQADTFKALGVNAIDPTTGQLRDANTVMAEVIDKLGKMDNETQADADAQILLGKSALELNPIIKAGSDQIAALTQAAHDNGAVMSGDAVEALAGFGHEMDSLKASASVAGEELAVQVIPTLEKLLDEVKTDGIPLLRSLLESVGTAVEDFSDLPAPLQATALVLGAIAVGIGPVLVGAGQLITAVGKIKTVIGDVTTSIAKSAAAKAVEAAATEAETVATEGATAAQVELDAAMDANPIGIVIAAVGALAAALGILAFSQNSETGEAAKFHQQMEQTSADLDTQTGKINSNAALEQQLATQLYDLAGKENKSNAEKAQMTSLVDQLNQMIPSLNLKISDESGALNQQKQAIDGVIESLRLQAIVQADNQTYVSYYQQQRDAQDSLDSVTKKVNDDLTALNKTTETSYDDMMAFTAAHDQAAAALETDQAEQKRLQGTVADLGKKMGDLNAADQKLAQSAYDASKATEKQTVDSGKLKNSFIELSNSAYRVTTSEKAWADSESSNLEKLTTAQQAYIMHELQGMDELTDEQKRTLTDQVNAMADYNNQLEQLTQQFISDMGGLGDKRIKQDHLTAQQVKKNLDQQIKDFDTWRASIKQISSRVSPEMLSELEALGPSAEGIIKGLNKMSDTDLAAWVKTWQTKSADAAGAAQDSLQDKAKAANAAGTQVGNDYALGITSTTPTVQAASSNLASTVPTALETVSGGAKLSDVLNTMGSNVSQSFADGIRSKIDVVKKAVQDMANAVPSTVSIVLDMHSPSKVMGKQADNTAAGYINNLRISVGAIRSVAAQMSEAAVPPTSFPKLSGLNFSGVQQALSGSSSGAQIIHNHNQHDITMPVTHNDQGGGWMSPALRDQFFREYDEWNFRNKRRTGRS